MGFNVRLLGIFFCVLLIVSCLQVDTDIRLKRNGRVDAMLNYHLSADIADFGRGFGFEEPWCLPLSEKDFIQQSLRISGVTIKKYKFRSNPDGSSLISVKLQADSIMSLSSFLNLDMKVDEQDGNSTFTLRMPIDGDIRRKEGDLALQMRESMGDASFLFRFRPAVRPHSTTAGIISGHEAQLEIMMGDLLNGKMPSAWVVSW